QHVDPLGRSRVEPTVEGVEEVAVHASGGVHQTSGVDQVTGALLVYVHRRSWKGFGHVADSTGVVEVDVGDGDAGKVVGSHPKLAERAEEDGNRALAAGLDEDGRGPFDQIARSDAIPAAE